MNVQHREGLGWCLTDLDVNACCRLLTLWAMDLDHAATLAKSRPLATGYRQQAARVRGLILEVRGHEAKMREG